MRQYFYEYYATDRDCAFDEAKKVKVRSLKALSGCSLMAGSILHRFAALLIDKKRSLSSAWVMKTALTSFDGAVSFSRDPRSQAHRLREKYPPQELLEYAYEDWDGDEASGQARAGLERALACLCGNSPVGRLVATLRSSEAHIEKRVSKLMLAEWPIGGQIDVLLVEPSNVRVLDWKLGGAEYGADSLQLYIYSWFAEVYLGVPRSSVSGQRVFLGDGVIETPQVVTDEVANVGRARLIQDVELMEELHRYGQEGREEAFRPCNIEGICRRCNYRAICQGAKLRPCSNAISA